LPDPTELAELLEGILPLPEVKTEETLDVEKPALLDIELPGRPPGGWNTEELELEMPNP
jgi:hypothetical protein